MTERNTPPADAFDVLRRLYGCNWSQLAERLGVTPRTLRTWREEGPGKTGAERMNRAFVDAMNHADAGWIALPINFQRIATINGKR